MLSKFVPALAGVAMAATVGSAFAFDAEIVAPKALRTHPSPRAAVITVIPAQSVINMERCVRGWCEAAYAGQVGFVYTPVLVSAGPAAPSPIDQGPTRKSPGPRRSPCRSKRPARLSTARPSFPARLPPRSPDALSASPRSKTGGGRVWRRNCLHFGRIVADVWKMSQWRCRANILTDSRESKRHVFFLDGRRWPLGSGRTVFAIGLTLVSPPGSAQQAGPFSGYFPVTGRAAARSQYQTDPRNTFIAGRSTRSLKPAPPSTRR